MRSNATFVMVSTKPWEQPDGVAVVKRRITSFGDFADDVLYFTEILLHLEQITRHILRIYSVFPKDFDWENPKKEAVAAAVAVGKEVINTLRSVPFLEDNETYQKCLGTIQEAWTGLGSVADTLFETKEFLMALHAAEANPAMAVQVKCDRI